MTRPVKVKKPTSLEAAAAYGVKSTFVRRVSYRKANLDREDRGECWNTRGRILRGDAWVELMLFLDRIGLQRRILLSTINLSVPPLHSRNDPRIWGDQMTCDGSASRRGMRTTGMVDHALMSTLTNADLVPNPCEPNVGPHLAAAVISSVMVVAHRCFVDVSCFKCFTRRPDRVRVIPFSSPRQ